MAEHFDFIVIGAGIEGSATAYHLAKRNKKTLLIEQHELGKSQGSSQGKSRVIRHSYKEEFFARMMVDAYAQWFKLEKEVGKELYIKTGLLIVEKSSSEGLKPVCESLEKNKIPFELLDSENLKTRFPSINYPGYNAVYEEDAGLLRADIALQTVQNIYISNGGHVKDNTKVINIEPNKDKIAIKTTNGNYTANSLIICAGPWAPELLQTLDLNLPIKKQDIKIFYWKELEEGMYSYKKFPSVLDFEDHFGMVDGLDFQGHVKGLLHLSDMSLELTPEEHIEKLQGYISEHFPGLDCTPSMELECYYTNTPDEVYILDHHPKYDNIIIGTGFSGTGFKIAPLVGEILANMAEGKSQDYDLTPFRMKRFA